MRAIKINKRDNVAVVIRDAEKGEELEGLGVVLNSDVPQGHKVALSPIKEGEPCIRYGVVLGYLVKDVRKGDWINEDMLRLPPSPLLSELKAGGEGEYPEFVPERQTWMGYDNGEGKFAGTRNILGITTTVQCCAGVLRAAVDRIRRELLPKYPNVDEVSALIHPYGCGVAIDAPDAFIPIRCVKNLAHHPNFGGELMVVSLGCEKLRVERILGKDEINSDNVVVLQECDGYSGMIDSIMSMAEKKLERLNKRRRTELPLSKLFVGTQCGGSDAFSGISANPSIGYALDLLAKGGAATAFSEVTEVRDAVEMIAARCQDEETVEKLKKEIGWYDEYLSKGGVDRAANTTPGNKKGGLSNIKEKSMGSIAKSGNSPIVDVLGPAEVPVKRGMHFIATPASDIVCGPTQLASGIGLQVFSTGRGTPYSLKEIPVVKLCTRHEIKEKWKDIFDIDTGDILTGKGDIHTVGLEVYNLILDIASGKKSRAEELGIYNDLIIDNPAPIT
ncbi:MAG: UxaA family hydrolase [Candidatus Ornithospirochaeta sp.]